MKRITAFLLAFALVTVPCPVVSFAADETVTACPSCGTALSELTYEAFAGSTTIIGDVHYQLTGNVALDAQVTVTGNLVLDLNGYSMYAAAGNRVFDVVGGTLTVIDSSEEQSGKLVGADVSGLSATDNAYSGGTIRVSEKGTLNMLSGTVTGGYAALGGNIFCAKGTFLNITGGTVTGGYAVALDGSTGRGGNIYTMATTTISGTAKLLNGYAQFKEGNSGRGGNLFVHNYAQVAVKGDAIIAGGYAGHRGGNILINYYSTLTVQENAQIYGGTARKYANNVDVMTSTLNIEGGTIYGSPAGGAETNIMVYSTSSAFNFTGGKIYGKIEALPGMTINISGKPYIEHLYLPQTLDADGNETARALIIPGTFEQGAWVGLEVKAADQVFTGALEDPSSYMFFFKYDKTGLTWYKRNGNNALYLTRGTPCQCCGEDKNDIVNYGKSIDITGESFAQGQLTLVAGHYRLTENVTLPEGYPMIVDGTEGYVTLDLNGYTISGNGAEVFTITQGSIFNIVDNTTNKAGVVKNNSARVMKVLGEGTEVNLYSGTLTGNTTGDNNYGGTVYITDKAVVNIYGGALDGGTCEDHGGNVFIGSSATLNLYDGAITGGTVTGGVGESGTAFTGNGGNIYVTGRYSVLNIYGGTISGGIDRVSSGGNVMVNSGGNVFMYAGVIENGGAIKYGANIYITGSSGSKYSQFYLYGGTLGAVDTSVANINGISRGTTSNDVRIYNGTVATTQKISHLLAECACYSADATGSYIWNYGHNEKTCDISCTMEEVWGKGYVKSLNTGLHDYTVEAGTGVCTCTLCGYAFYQENMVAVVGGKVYDSLPSALAKAEEGTTVTMLGDAVETEIAISGITLDLNGNTLTVDAFSSVGGNLIDSTGGKGLLVTDSVSLAENNAHLPISTTEGLRFSSITPDHTLERLDEDTVRVRFTFRERSQDTLLDDLIKAGNTDMTVELKLTWTDTSGNPREQVYVCDPALLVKYAEKWNGRRYVATITGVDAISDLTCTVQVSSTAATGVTVAATTLNNVAYINQKLSWDAINSYPLKTKDMTVAQMRQAVIDFMYFTKTYLWTPDQSVDYIRNGSGSADSMTQGTVYGGLPYVGVATGNVYRMMDYINPETGLLDMEKAIPALAYKDSVTMADLKYFGSQCSVAVYWGWGRVMNSAKYTWTSSVVPNNDFIILGDVQIPDIPGWSTTYGTDECCEENGEQVMFEGYAQLQKADGLVYYTTAGHLVMAYSDAVVVRNSDGTINGDESYIYLIDQAQTWKTLTNDAGDTFKHKNGINEKYTFTKLFDTNYIPFTFAEFTGEAAIQDTTVALVDADGNRYVDGTIRESDRAYITTTTTSTIAWDTLFTSRVRSNYGIVDVYVTLYNQNGEQFYRHAVRTDTAGNKNLSMEEEGEMVTIWQLANVFKDRSYKAKIEVQLATGERVTVFNGQLTT